MFSPFVYNSVQRIKISQILSSINLYIYVDNISVRCLQKVTPQVILENKYSVLIRRRLFEGQYLRKIYILERYLLPVNYAIQNISR